MKHTHFAIMVVIALVAITSFASAYSLPALPTRDYYMQNVPSQDYSYGSYQGYTNDLAIRAQIASRYGLNPIYIAGNSYPGAHTVTEYRLDIMCLPGVDEAFVKQALANVNPFYKFRFITPDPALYTVSSKTGLFESASLGTIVISKKAGECAHCGCGTTGQCCPVSLWIDEYKPVTPEQFGDLIEMECDHLIGPVSPDGSDTHQYTSEQITDAYTEASKQWGTVRVTRFTGSGTTSWVVYV